MLTCIGPLTVWIGLLQIVARISSALVQEHQKFFAPIAAYEIIQTAAS
jgi:hypothetical protein